MVAHCSAFPATIPIHSQVVVEVALLIVALNAILWGMAIITCCSQPKLKEEEEEEEEEGAIVRLLPRVQSLWEICSL